MADKVFLTEKEFVGAGKHRSCYAYPGDPSRVIKVLHEASERELRSVAHELDYYRWLDKHLKDWRGIPRFYETVETNLGTGYVYECVRDFDGKISETMKQRYGVFDKAKCREFADIVQNG